MRYTTVDTDVLRPLPTVTLRPDDAGLAVLLRRGGRPIHFSLHELPGGTVVSPEGLRALAGEAAERAAQRAAVHEELAAGVAPAPPDVTAAICTRGRPDLLADCLASIRKMRAGAGGLAERLEVLVVDNAPPDEATRELVEDLPGVRYVREDLPGLDFARNRALREARSAFVAYLDDDVAVDAGWLAGLAEALHEHPDAAAVTGLVLPFELETAAQVAFERRGGFGRGVAKKRFHGPDLAGNPVYPCGAGIFGAGCNMAFRRSVAMALGGFDEALDTGPPLPGGGDLDMFYRVVRAGHPLVYEPRMAVFHRHRRDHRGLRRQYWTWGTGFMAFVAKTHRTDPAQRRKLRRLVRWWLRDQAAGLVRSAQGRSPLSPDLVAAELAGGIVGLGGTYGRSRRRTAALREASR